MTARRFFFIIKLVQSIKFQSQVMELFFDAARRFCSFLFFFSVFKEGYYFLFPLFFSKHIILAQCRSGKGHAHQNNLPFAVRALISVSSGCSVLQLYISKLSYSHFVYLKVTSLFYVSAFPLMYLSCFFLSECSRLSLSPAYIPKMS